MRLRDINAILQGQAIKRFQFNHCGIKSVLALSESSPASYFNSTIVRLRDKLAASDDELDQNCNSTIVRLRDLVGLSIGNYLSYFNSTIVRLRALGFKDKDYLNQISIQPLCD